MIVYVLLGLVCLNSLIRGTEIIDPLMCERTIYLNLIEMPNENVNDVKQNKVYTHTHRTKMNRNE